MIAHYRTRMARGERGVVAPVNQSPRRRGLTPTQRMRKGASRLRIPLEEYRGHVEQGERWCSPHQRWEPIAGFVNDRTTSDGIGHQCKAFAREYQRGRRAS